MEGVSSSERTGAADGSGSARGLLRGLLWFQHRVPLHVRCSPHSLSSSSGPRVAGCGIECEMLRAWRRTVPEGERTDSILLNGVGECLCIFHMHNLDVASPACVLKYGVCFRYRRQRRSSRLEFASIPPLVALAVTPPHDRRPTTLLPSSIPHTTSLSSHSQ